MQCTRQYFRNTPAFSFHTGTQNFKGLLWKYLFQCHVYRCHAKHLTVGMLLHFHGKMGVSGAQFLPISTGFFPNALHRFLAVPLD